MRILWRYLFIFPLAFCILQLAYAQPLPERAPIIGKVVNTNGLPVGGAVVALNRQDKDVVGEAAFWGGKQLTGADGAFNFSEAEEGVYYLSVDAAGYENFGWTLEWQPQSPLFVAKLLKLTPQPLRILKPDGQPATEARVFLHLRGQPPGHVSFPAFVTDATGKITTEPITPANYWLHVLMPGVGYAVVPNLIVKENEPKLTDIQLKVGGRVRATVRTPDGKPIGGVALMLKELPPAGRENDQSFQGNDGSIYMQAQPRPTLVSADGSGQIEIGDVAPGRYQVRFYMPGETNPIGQTVDVKSGETADVNGVYNLQESKVAVKVAVRTADDKPSADRWFVARFQPVRNGNPVPYVQTGPPIPPDVAPSIVNLFLGTLTRRFKTDGEGKATIFPIRAGDWQVTVLPEDQLNAEKPAGVTSILTVNDQDTQWTFKLKE